MSHTFHEGLEGYDARQILHDGCDECEYRGADLRAAFAHMDPTTFNRAWRRAFDMNASNGDHGNVGRESRCEANLLHVLFAIQVEFERRGIPLDGNVPSGTPDWMREQREQSLRQADASIEQERWRKHDEGR